MKLFLLFLFLSLSSRAAVTELQLGGGLIMTQPVENRLLDDHFLPYPRVDLVGGVKTLTSLKADTHFRSGLYVRQRTAGFTDFRPGDDSLAEYKLLTMGLPLNLQKKLNGDLHIYGGYFADYLLNHYCDVGRYRYGQETSCRSQKKPQSFMHSANLGFSLEGSVLSFDLEYQHGIGHTYPGTRVWAIQGVLYFKL